MSGFVIVGVILAIAAAFVVRATTRSGAGDVDVGVVPGKTKLAWIAAGVSAGLVAALVATLVVTGGLLPAIGAGDAMSRGIGATLTLVFAAPVFAVLGGVLGYRRALRGARKAVIGQGPPRGGTR